MDEEKPKHAGGRPATGVTPKRNIRMGQTWEDGEEIAAENGESMTAYVERAVAAANLRHRREQQRLSKASGVVEGTIQRWKSGER